MSENRCKVINTPDLQPGEIVGERSFVRLDQDRGLIFAYRNTPEPLKTSLINAAQMLAKPIAQEPSAVRVPARPLRTLAAQL